MADARANRFVIHHHTGHGPDHWDLMLEHGHALATWRLQRMPDSDDPDPIPATHIFDHRKSFLTYEGPISQGRGQVRIVESGTFTTADRTEDAWSFVAQGRAVQGRFILERPTGRGHAPDQWQLRVL
ncbi:MAG: hypothetical protein JXQ73_31580 [Phycisphaerae bacterium]|nr:hypothetical protein [Phycisphaerae bacterium]